MRVTSRVLTIFTPANMEKMLSCRCVSEQESLKSVWEGAVTEEVMNDIGTAEWQAAYITGVHHRVQQSCCKSPCYHFQADRPGHDQGVKERAAYGHIAVMGH